VRGNQTLELRVGQPFNPFKLYCGSFIPEPICKYRGLSLGAKVIYGRLCRYAGEDGSAFPAVPTLADETGIGETQAREYVKELEQQQFINVDRENRHYRKDGSGGSNGYTFLWHTAYLGDLGSFRKAPPPLRKTGGVPLRKTEPLTPAENRTRRESASSRESGKESQPKADSQPPNRKSDDSAAVGRSPFVRKPRTDVRKVQLPGSVKPLPVEKQTREPAYRLDWDDEELSAVEDFLSEEVPEMLEEWEQDGDVPDWLSQATLDAGLGATPEEVLTYLRTSIDSGWNPPNWKSYPAVVRHEFERRQNRARGKRWSDSDLAALRAGLKKYMEGDEPPERFEYSCELRANGATAREVLELIERKWRNKKYRPGGQHGPRGWNWFLQVVGNEFSVAERSHLSESPAAPHSDHQATPEEMTGGIDVLDSLVASYACKCGAEIRQYNDRVIGTCTCGFPKPVARATIPQIPAQENGVRRMSRGSLQ